LPGHNHYPNGPEQAVNIAFDGRYPGFDIIVKNAYKKAVPNTWNK